MQSAGVRHALTSYEVGSSDGNTNRDTFYPCLAQTLPYLHFNSHKEVLYYTYYVLLEIELSQSKQ